MKQTWKESYQRYNEMIQEEKRMATPPHREFWISVETVSRHPRQSENIITCEEDCILVEQARDRLRKSINDYRRNFGRPSPVTL